MKWQINDWLGLESLISKGDCAPANFSSAILLPCGNAADIEKVLRNFPGFVHRRGLTSSNLAVLENNQDVFLLGVPRRIGTILTIPNCLRNWSGIAKIGSSPDQ